MDSDSRSAAAGDPLGAFVDRLVTRRPLPHDARKLPWDDPAFSTRMLREHLDQRHDRASRTSAKIDAHVDWIFRGLLGGRPSQVLDLGCGPGLHTERLARLGCRCRGIDISPASIDHARTTSSAQALDCTYLLGDIRTADLGDGNDLAMLLFGEFNTFTRTDAAQLLERVAACLRPGGTLLLEAHTFDSVAAEGTSAKSWYTADRGLFSDHPHLVLSEHRWDESSSTTSTRLHVVDDSGTVAEYSETLHAYHGPEYLEIITAAGLDDAALLDDVAAFGDPAMVVITARRRPHDAVERLRDFGRGLVRSEDPSAP